MVQSTTPQSKHDQDQPRLLRQRRINSYTASASRQQPSRIAKTAAVQAVNGTSSTSSRSGSTNNNNNKDSMVAEAAAKPTRKRRAPASSSSSSLKEEEANGSSVSRKRRNNSNHTAAHQSAATAGGIAAKHSTITQETKPYRAGDQVEALKWVDDDTREWYCARVVTNLNERATEKRSSNGKGRAIDDGATTATTDGDYLRDHKDNNNKNGDAVHSENESVLLVHYEGWTADHADWVGASSVHRVPEDREGRMRLRYGPQGKESETSWADYRTFYYSQEAISLVKHHTGLVQDQRMGWHDCPCHSQEHIHPERPDRINAILKALHNDRLLRYFGRIRAREATIEELLKVHSLLHVGSYCPVDTVESVADNLMTESNPRATTITSIRDLLNQPTSETPSPLSSPPPTTTTAAAALSTTTTTVSSSAASETETTTTVPSAEKTTDPTPARAQGVEGGKVVKADKNQIRKQRRRFSSAAASQAALNGTVALVNPPQLVYEMTCGELAIAVDTPFHPLYTSISARMAAGSLMELTDQVVEGSLHNGFALIRPPGHHAENDRAMGFCFFNNVAVAVASTMEKYPDVIKKVLIIDWDIHHGNGTEKIFYNDPNVLYVSLHRWEHGSFYPRSGAPDQCGEDAGEGRNVNIAFNTSTEKPRPMGDTEFLAAFYHIVLPIARQFAPDMIFVSAGFDAAEGHPDNIGGYQVTPRGFAMLTKLTKDLAEEVCGGRLVLSLEGGYELEPLANSAAACVAQLLPAELVPDVQLKYEGSLRSVKPNHGAVQSLRTVAEIQRKYWKLPDELTDDPTFRFLLPAEWRAKDSISIRPKRTVKPMKITAVEGY